MPSRQTLNMTQVLGVTGVNLATGITVTTIGAANSQEFYEFATADKFAVYLEVSALTGTGSPSLTVKLQERNPGTGNWADLAGAAFTAQTATTTAPIRITVDPNFSGCLRAVWTTAGSTISVTFSVTAYLYIAAGG